MKIPLLSRVAFLAGAFATAGLTAAFAQDQPSATPPPGPGEHHHHEPALTPDERTQLKTDTDAVFAADPDLKAEGDKLKQDHEAMKGTQPSDEDKKAFHEKMHAYFEKLNAAIVKQDPSAAPILAKLKAGHHHGPPPADG
jgi:hypothetical protein